MMGPMGNRRQGRLLFLAVLGFAVLVVLAAVAVAVPRLSGGAKPAAGQGDLSLALDMDVTNGSGPCDPDHIDDSADRALGESYQVAICVGGLQQAVAVFSATVLYDDYLYSVPEISCSTGDCLDDNPDANAGETTWGDGLGEGWSCNILNKAEPMGYGYEDGGEAFIACLSASGPYSVGDDETWGVLAVVNFQAVYAGVDSLSFGGPAENTLGDAGGVEMGTCGASKDIPCYGGTVNISMTPVPSPTPTPTTTPTPDTGSGPVTTSGGGTVTSDDEENGVSPSDPIDTTVSVPAGSASTDTTVTITEASASDPGMPPAPSDLQVLGQVAVIDTDPEATFSSENPASLTITYDQSVAPPDELTIQVSRFDGDEWVPLGEPCSGGIPGTPLDPDPCISARDTDTNTITINTTALSHWALMAPLPSTPVGGIAEYPALEPVASAGRSGSSALSATPLAGAVAAAGMLLLAGRRVVR